jgi:hypothetical protein
MSLLVYVIPVTTAGAHQEQIGCSNALEMDRTPIDAHADEQRRLMRVTLLHPLPGLAEGERIYIVDASLSGIRLSHQSLFATRTDCGITFDWDGTAIDLVGQVRWTRAQRLGSASFAKTLYQSGLQIAAMTPEAQVALRSLVESHVERALDEQKANAKGIPQMAAQSLQPGGGAIFARHEFSGGVWRKITTPDARQPSSGFTVSVAELRAEVDLLRAAYETADGVMRDMIRKFAALSISNAEGVPTRRYIP